MAIQNVTYKIYSPGQLTNTYFYGHAGDNTVAFNTYNNTLCGAYTAFAYGVASYIPYDLFPLFTNMVPQSAYLLYISNQSNVVIPVNKKTNGDNTITFPSSYTIRPGYNFITMDPNSLSGTIASFGVTSTNTDIIYGTADGIKYVGDEANLVDGLRYQLTATYNPAGAINTNFFTSFQPGSAYLIVAKQTYTINITRRAQYIITDSGNTAPTGPGYILTTESGNRITTGVSG